MSTATFPRPPRHMDRDEFIDRFGGVYEHSTWVAELAWDSGVSEAHDSVAGLAQMLAGAVDAAPEEQRLALIRAHPDLAGKAAVRGELTAASTSEQASAGIDQCSTEEFDRFQRCNEAYKQKFGFPFVMAVKGSNRDAILAAFERRLENDHTTEFGTALEEIHKIARLRLDHIAQQDG